MAANVPHNMMVADRGARVFIIPNAFSERKAKGQVPEELLDCQVDPATFEICGHIVLKRAQDFETVDQDFCWRLLAQSAYDEQRFLKVAAIALSDVDD